MPTKRLTMRKIREILRLKYDWENFRKTLGKTLGENFRDAPHIYSFLSKRENFRDAPHIYSFLSKSSKPFILAILSPRITD